MPSARRPTGGWAFPARTSRARGPRPRSSPGTTATRTSRIFRSTSPPSAVVVVGNGNVAVDVARMLALTAEEIEPTDTTDEAIAAIVGSGIREILVLGRRGPGAGCVHDARAAGADRARRRRPRDRSGRPRARPGERGGSRGRHGDRAPQCRPDARGGRQAADGQAEDGRAALRRLAGRDPRRRPRRGRGGRPERARRPTRPEASAPLPPRSAR